MVRKIILIAYLIICWSLCPALARDPNVAELAYSGEVGILGGSDRWTFADTWTVCGVAAMVVLLYALPRVFDGPEYSNIGFLSESRKGFNPLNNRWLTSNGLRGDSWCKTRLKVGVLLPADEFRATGLIINSETAHFKFPTRKFHQSLIR